MTSNLNVWFGAHRVGELLPAANHGLRFQYATEWMNHPMAFAISQSLPLQSGVYEGSQVNAFFGGWLPSGSTKALLAQRLQLSESNTFGLLQQVGGDVPGALQLLPVDESPESQAPNYQTLSTEEMDQLLAFLPQQPLLAGTDNGIRLTLPGVQHKLPLHCDDEQFALPRNGAVSTHIVKLDNAQYPHVVANEAYCMWLAKACGLDVPTVSILRQTKRSALAVERFDRNLSDHPVQRLHQENFCQAYGLLPDHHYEHLGGLGFRACRELIDQAVLTPAVARRRLLEWALFNWVIGHADAHGKNLTLVYDQLGQASLAPFYGLISTMAYPSLGQKMAMAYGGERNLQLWQPPEREQFLADLDVTGRLARQVVGQLNQRIEKHALMVANDKRFTADEQLFIQQIAASCLSRLPQLTGF